MIFVHRQTGKPVLEIGLVDNTFVKSNSYWITHYRDLPDVYFEYSDLHIPPGLARSKEDFYDLLMTFLRDEIKDFNGDFWFILFPSGFPDGKIPTKENKLQEKK